MKKFIFSAIAGVATGYFIRKIQDKVQVMKITENSNGSESKPKSKLKTSINSTGN